MRFNIVILLCLFVQPALLWGITSAKEEPQTVQIILYTGYLRFYKLEVIGKNSTVDSLPLRYGTPLDRRNLYGGTADRWQFTTSSQFEDYVVSSVIFSKGPGPGGIEKIPPVKIFQAQMVDRMRRVGWHITSSTTASGPDTYPIYMWFEKS